MKQTEYEKILCSKIKSIRKRLKLKQFEFANILNCNRQRLDRIENNESVPSCEMLFNLYNYLKTHSYPNFSLDNFLDLNKTLDVAFNPTVSNFLDNYDSNDDMPDPLSFANDNKTAEKTCTVTGLDVMEQFFTCPSFNDFLQIFLDTIDSAMLQSINKDYKASNYDNHSKNDRQKKFRNNYLELIFAVREVIDNVIYYFKANVNEEFRNEVPIAKKIDI